MSIFWNILIHNNLKYLIAVHIIAHIYTIKVGKKAKQIQYKLKRSIFSEKENSHLSDNNKNRNMHKQITYGHLHWMRETQKTHSTIPPTTATPTSKIRNKPIQCLVSLALLLLHCSPHVTFDMTPMFLPPYTCKWTSCPLNEGKLEEGQFGC